MDHPPSHEKRDDIHHLDFLFLGASIIKVLWIRNDSHRVALRTLCCPLDCRTLPFGLSRLGRCIGNCLFWLCSCGLHLLYHGTRLDLERHHRLCCLRISIRFITDAEQLSRPRPRQDQREADTGRTLWRKSRTPCVSVARNHRSGTLFVLYLQQSCIGLVIATSFFNTTHHNLARNGSNLQRKRIEYRIGQNSPKHCSVRAAFINRINAIILLFFY